MRVQLLTFAGCPHAEAARETLRSVLVSSAVVVPIEDVDTNAPGTPEALRGWGSPTILINGEDAEGQDAPTGASCRLYRDQGGRLRGTPTQALLRSALTRAT